MTAALLSVAWVVAILAGVIRARDEDRAHEAMLSAIRSLRRQLERGGVR